MNKNVLTGLVCLVSLLFVNQSFSQLEDGSIAPDFTVTDIDGQEHNLYSYLDDGYTVILNFSATWCTNCWGYFNSEAMIDLWAFHGPAGEEGVNMSTSDDVVVLFVEADDETTLEDILGTGEQTHGDWTEDAHYPIIDDQEALFDMYECVDYPTVFTICPNRFITETGNLNELNHYIIASEYSCSEAEFDNDVYLVSYTGDSATCGDIDASVYFQNFGLLDITEATFEINGCTTCPETVTWEGNLSTYENEDFELGTYSVDESGELTISYIDGDDYELNDQLDVNIQFGADATSLWTLDILTDCFPEEIGWNVKDEDDNVLFSVEPGTYTSELSTYTENFNLEATGCFTFTFDDTFGDGLQGSQWAGCDEDGSYTLSHSTGTIDFYDGSYDFDSRVAKANVTVVSIDEITKQMLTWNVYPNPANDVLNLNLNLNNPSETRIDFFNSNGQLVMSENLGKMISGNNQRIINLSSLESGLYLVSLITEGNISTQKIEIN